VAKWLIGSGCRLGGQWGRSKDGCSRWGGDRRKEGAVLGVNFRASHCNQYGLDGDALFPNYFGGLVFTYLDGFIDILAIVANVAVTNIQ